MDLKTIENEVHKFNAVYFREEIEVVESSFDFIINNHLHTPKENYTIVLNFLNTTLRNFRVLDSKFMSDTLQKLFVDVKYLQDLQATTQTKTKDIEEIFNKKFLSNSHIFNTLTKEITSLQLSKVKSEEDQVRLKQLVKNFAELKRVYFETFKNIFNEQKRYLLKSVLSILNTKAYYIDKLLWKEATESPVINKHFKVLQISDRPNTKNYLLYTTGLMRPYTKEYQYLQSCLRIYK